MVTYSEKRFFEWHEDNVSVSLRARSGSYGGGSEVLVMSYQDVTDTMMASGYDKLGTQEAQNGLYVTERAAETQYVVRRLTPEECEILQGYPVGYTDIGEWIDSKGKVRQTTDSARYKALGNSICLPPWKWVLKRICAQYERDATMGSLFDGIGGFPLIWEQLNYPGSCLWASEIEEFPIAVTERRINGNEMR